MIELFNEAMLNFVKLASNDVSKKVNNTYKRYILNRCTIEYSRSRQDTIGKLGVVIRTIVPIVGSIIESLI